ncbi:MAG: hypothetical protein HY262_10410 [Chloroflexi bacterium]|nr:hypothetical protein [Chloroflexota bacterium]
MCQSCEDEEEQAAATAQAEELAHITRQYGESRQRWLFWGNIATIVIMAMAVLGTLQKPSSYRSVLEAALGLLLVTAIGILSVWALADSGGFRHKTYDPKSARRKVLYWLGASIGLAVGIVFVVIALIAMAVLAIGGSVAGEEIKREKAKSVIRQGVREGVEDAFR